MAERLIQVGLNHLRAPIEFRERLLRAAEPMAESLARLRQEARLEQLVTLSTCSRFELYAVCDNPSAGREALARWFEERAGKDVRQALDERSGVETVEHLFRVAAGLESWIYGESEILNQVKKAYQDAFAARLTGPELNRIFQAALAAGKAVRTQTGIQNGIHSIGGASALLARRIFGEPQAGSVVVFGAGEAAEAVCRHLSAKNFGNITVANRTLARAEELARKVSGTGVTFEEGLARLSQAEVAVFSASCLTPFVVKTWLKTAVAGRKRPLFLIDLGLPRNVEPACDELDNVYLYDLDDLKDVVRESLQRKAAATRDADAIVSEAVGETLRQLEKAKSRLTAAREALS